jgi:CheY-like chemotaxis protein
VELPGKRCMAANSTDARTRDLLIVDDDPAQAHLFELLVRELGLKHRCFHAAGGVEALDFLHRKSPFQNAPRPALIILDLNMPGMDGYAVLREIKADPDLRHIPVIMFSSTSSDQHFARCYRESANACIRKPADYEAGLEVVREIERFWFATAVLPR